MDPTATWVELSEDVRNAEWHAAKRRAEDLLGWLAKDGFPPIITGVAAFDRIAAESTCKAILKR